MPPADLLFLDIAVVLLASRALGTVARLLGQPRVIGEIVAGIVLGPTLLGLFIGDRLFPPMMIPPLNTLADLGLVLFMFVVGLDMDPKLLRSVRAVGSVVAGATALPFALGIGLALLLVHSYAPGATLPFILFVTISVSATAFPVLARILSDRGITTTLLGGISLASAAVIDVFVYTLLAITVAIGSASGHESWRLALVPVYALVMFTVVRPLLRRSAAAFEKAGRLRSGLLCTLLFGLFMSAWATQWMQIHFIFGAFLFGVVIPRSDAFVTRLRESVMPAVQLALPMFFVITGLTVDLTALHPTAGLVLAAILAVAIVGKVGGGYVGGRLAGIPSRGSALLGVLVNTRGLTELVILTVGLQQHLIGRDLYSLLVVMALVTTATTGPLISWLYPGERLYTELMAERAYRTGVASKQ